MIRGRNYKFWMDMILNVLIALTLIFMPNLGYATSHKDISGLSEALARNPVYYSRGGSLEYGVATDCSGFTQFIFRHGFSVNLPRSSVEQARVGQVVTRKMDFSKLLPGDLLLFSDQERPIGHAGIYLGHGLMIHASSARGKVVITDIREGYYNDNFVVAKRFLKEPGPKPPISTRPRVIDSSPEFPGPPPALFPISNIMPAIASKLLKIFWPWDIWASIIGWDQRYTSDRLPRRTTKMREALSSISQTRR
ncbi:MAG: C40 family peptidase [Thermodesulfobacteriota bacterium]